MVVDEMADHEPVVGVDIRLGADQAQAEPAPAGIEGLDAMHQGHPAAGQGERVGQVEPVERRTKRSGQVTPAQGLDLALIKRQRRDRHQVGPVGRLHSRAMPGIEGPRNDALAGGQLRGRKEPRAAVAHGQERFAPDGPVELEAEEVRIALAEKSRDLDVVADRLARAGQVRGGR